MVVGMPNLYQLSPLTKMMISSSLPMKLGKTLRYLPELGSTFSVLYNPQTLRISRSFSQGKDQAPGEKGENAKVPMKNGQNLNNGTVQTMLEVDLFIDTMSAGPEIYGATDMLYGAKNFTDSLKFLANSQVPAVAKFISASKYVEQLMELTYKDDEEHMVKPIILTWGVGIRFVGYLISCQAEYTKFSDLGLPVRAIVHCTFACAEFLAPKSGLEDLRSPDISRFHTVEQGERMSDLALDAYGDAGQWRHIAQANGVINPRAMQTGQVLRMPAIK